MKPILVLCLIFLSPILARSQDITAGLYVNEESNEYVCFYEDSVQFRILNYDALGTFSIGKGKYDIRNNKGKYYILACNSLIEQTSKVDRISRNDSLIVIKVLYDDGTPMAGAYTYFKNPGLKKKSILGVSSTDEDGQIVLSESQINRYTNKELLIQIEALGFSTKKLILLKSGYDFIIQSIIPKSYPFSLFKTGRVFIYSPDSQKIEIELWRSPRERKRYGKSQLTKVNTDIQCSNFLFDKDLTGIFRE